MKKPLLLLIIILFCFCKSETKKVLETEKEQNLTELNVEKLDNSNLKPISEIDTKTEFDINYIKTKTKTLSKKIDLEIIDVKNLEKIPGEFITKYITPHKIEIGYPEYLHADYPEAYAFNEFKEYEDFYLYTFTYDDESCCRTLYAVTAEKDSLKTISISVIGYTGGDGGWGGKKYGKWFSDYGIENTDVSIYDEESAEQNKETEIDTTWSEIQLSKKGVFKYIEHHKVKYIGNKQVE
ncbi:hypothetical protein [Tenacibaculum geojense]|uniref:Lipoprotein n=1 Tax=Tenacibaculum geojense TaxID=915352 RepID=A0ABW3JQ53_9FLAO